MSRQCAAQRHRSWQAQRHRRIARSRRTLATPISHGGRRQKVRSCGDLDSGGGVGTGFCGEHPSYHRGAASPQQCERAAMVGGVSSAKQRVHTRRCMFNLAMKVHALLQSGGEVLAAIASFSTKPSFEGRQLPGHPWERSTGCVLLASGATLQDVRRLLHSSHHAHVETEGTTT